MAAGDLPNLQPGTQGFLVTDHFPLIQQLTLKPPGPTIPVAYARLDRFERDDYTGYRRPSLRHLRERGTDVTDPGEGENGYGSVTFPTDHRGPFHLGFVLYDSPGDERLGVWVDGQNVGRITAVHGDQRQYLYVSTEAQPLGVRSQVRLVAQTPGAPYRLEELLLLPDLPELPPRRLPRVRDLTAVPRWQVEPHAPGDAGEMVITWWTASQSRCTCAAAGPDGTWSRAGQTAGRNHRIVLSQLVQGANYRVRVDGETHRGEPLEGTEIAFTAGRMEGHERSPGRPNIIRVPLEITSLPPAPLSPWPVRFGVPVEQGQFPAGQEPALVLMDGPGRSLPVQRQVVGRWGDGSLRWLLVDAMVPGGMEVGTLELGTPAAELAAPEPGLPQVTVEDEETTISVESGQLSITLDRSAPGWFKAIHAGQGPALHPLTALRLTAETADGTVYEAQKPSSMEVEAAGPVRVTICITGSCVDAGGRPAVHYTCRLHAYAGSPWFAVSCTCAAAAHDEEFWRLRSLRLHLEGPFDNAAGRIGSAGGGLTVSPGERGRLLQWLDRAYAAAVGDPLPGAGEGERLAGDGEQAPGWCSLTGAGTLGAVVSEFWQQYPAALEVGPDGIWVDLAPQLPEGTYDGEAQGDDAHRLFYWFDGGCYRLRQGVATTRNLLVHLSPKGTELELEELARRANRPPVVVMPRRYYARTGVFDGTGRAGQLDSLYNQAARAALRDLEQERRFHRLYGWLNYGDWWGERNANWGNGEYDTAWGMLRQFVRTGEPEFLHAGLLAERHHRDVDTVHHHQDPERIGGVWAHAIGHTGGYYDEPPITRAGTRGIVNAWTTVSHTWVDGHLAAYFLSGDPQALAAATKVADRYCGPELNHFDFNTCREPGWHLILATAMYRATWDPYYLNACRIMVERVLERQTPDGGWQRQLQPGHCFCRPRHQGNAGFMVAVLLYGLERYRQLSGDERVAGCMERAAAYLLERHWHAGEAAFRYTACPRTPLRYGDIRIVGALAQVYDLHGDQRVAGALKTMLQQRLAASLARRAQDTGEAPQEKEPHTYRGKSHSIFLWFTPRALPVLDRLAQSVEQD